jgi:Zn-dependent protease
MKREKRFVLRSAIACWVGGFFTILYLIFATSLFLDKPTASMNPSYQYLAEVNGDLESYVFLLENGELQEFQQQLDMEFTSNPERHWAIDNASALAKFQEYDLDGALSDFRIAAEKNPERSEFYFYYGLVLLENDQEEIAVEQFKNALVHKPNLEIAKRYVTLIETSYKPSTIISSVLFIIILLILFTLHEYGHAFAAWKLGDDTAKNSGRLTLNPIPHLDLFGSILLPAFLLIQQSDVIFGWAKPVPVNPENFKDPQKDHMRVSFAGPAINFIVSMVCTVLLGVILLFVRILWPETLSLNISDPFSSVSLMGPPFARLIVFAIVLLKQLLYTSLILGCFNLIPIPPLDGSWVFAGLLPQKVREILEKARKFSYVVFLLLVLTPAFDYIISIPISIVWGGLELLVLSMGFA